MFDYFLYFLFMALSFISNGQSIGINSINFYDTLKFNQNIIRKTGNQNYYVTYNEKDGHLTKIDYFDSKNRKVKDKIWNDTLIREIEYIYCENDQVIKCYDVINKKPLPTQLKVNIRYPALARENGITGVIEVKLNFNDDCVPVSYEILNSLGHGINEEVNKGMKTIIKLSAKYNISFARCKELTENLKINFILD